MSNPFNCKMEISRELTEFLGLPEGTYTTIAESTYAITNYVIRNNLLIIRNSDKKCIIMRDEKLNKIFAENANETRVPGYTGPREYCTDVTVMNLDEFIKHNYLRKAPDEFQPTTDEIDYGRQCRLAKIKANHNGDASINTTIVNRISKRKPKR